jgi:glucosyl-3-phosphoglycerate synthase
MADFYQTGVISTFHKLGQRELFKIEGEIEYYSRQRPIALVLPSLYSELQGEALKNIVQELKQVGYIREIVVTLGPASRDEFDRAKEFFSALPQKTTIIWNSGRHIKDIQYKFQEAGLDLGMEGKGKSAWMAYGYVISKGECDVIALHDCDILSYDRMMLARLCYPAVNPSLNYEFCKGFYSRVTDRMHGRVTRLLVTPLIRALERMVGYVPLLVFMDSFRYPLAGEFAMHTDLIRTIRIPGDWGLEVGVLAEVYRNCALRRICQVDIADNYEHKHQALSPEDPEKGLMKMCVDICKSVFRTLASEGVTTYVRTAQDMLKRYEDDAAINGLFFDRHGEHVAIEAFTKGIRMAAATILEDPLGAPLITSWDRVTSAVPDAMDLIRTTVEEDNK